jgi:hypothetical protein
MMDKMNPQVMERINLISNNFLSDLSEVRISDLLAREGEES